MSNTDINVNRTQLFSRGERVQWRIGKNNMSPSVSNGIILCTHHEEFNSNDVHSYKILALDGDSNPTNEIKWIHERSINSVYLDLDEGLKIIEQYYNEKEA